MLGTLTAEFNVRDSQTRCIALKVGQNAGDHHRPDSGAVLPNYYGFPVFLRVVDGQTITPRQIPFVRHRATSFVDVTCHEQSAADDARCRANWAKDDAF
jgi:hypothetical protein